MSTRSAIFAGVAIGVIVVLVGGTYFLLNRPQDSKQLFIQALNLNQEEAQHVFLNLPPQPSRYPGTVYSSLWASAYRVTDDNDPRLTRGNPIEVTIKYDANASLKDSLRAFLMAGFIRESRQ